MNLRALFWVAGIIFGVYLLANYWQVILSFAVTVGFIVFIYSYIQANQDVNVRREKWMRAKASSGCVVGAVSAAEPLLLGRSAVQLESRSDWLTVWGQPLLGETVAVKDGVVHDVFDP